MWSNSLPKFSHARNAKEPPPGTVSLPPLFPTNLQGSHSPRQCFFGHNWTLNTVNFGYIQGSRYSIGGYIQALLWSRLKLFYVSVTKFWLYSIRIYPIIGYIQAHSQSLANTGLAFFSSAGYIEIFSYFQVVCLPLLDLNKGLHQG